MTRGLHLDDEVEIVTDRFHVDGVPRGSIGLIVDQWADGSNDIEVHDQTSGQVIARFRAAPGEVQAYDGPIEVKEPRKHGILFGRGDEPSPDEVAPPMTMPTIGAIAIPGVAPAPIAFGEPPAEVAEVEGDIPWELQDEPPSGPIFH